MKFRTFQDPHQTDYAPFQYFTENLVCNSKKIYLFTLFGTRSERRNERKDCGPHQVYGSDPSARVTLAVFDGMPSLPPSCFGTSAMRCLTAGPTDPL
jgi:hypothetical protein